MTILDNIWLNRIKMSERPFIEELELRIDLTNDRHYAIRISYPYGVLQIQDALREGVSYLSAELKR